jgi:hypothetical protein
MRLPRTALALTAAALTLPSAAQAANCERAAGPLVSDGVPFSLGSSGEFQDSYYGYDNRAFDSAGYVYLRTPADDGFGQWFNEQPEGCTVSADGRTVTFPAGDRYAIDNDASPGLETPASSGLEVRRRVTVPPTGGFARIVDTFRNPGGGPLTFDIGYYVNHYSDGNAGVTSTSSGDTLLSPADRWAVISDVDPGEPPSAPDALLVWGSEQGAPDPADVVSNQNIVLGTPTSDSVSPRWTSITLQPGETTSLLTLYSLGTARGAEVPARGARLSPQPPEVTAGLTAAEIADLRNWALVGDGDRDGRPNDADNCVAAANGDQADLDGDGAGDACDADVDGDGLSDQAEAAFRTNARSGDTDGDGIGDFSDGCPTTAGRGANGCPRFDALPVDPTPAERLGLRAAPRALTARLTPSRDTRAPYRFRVTGTITPPLGVSARDACGGSLGIVSVQTKRGQTTLSTRRADLRRDCTFSLTLSFGNARRFGSARSLRVSPRFLGNAIMTPAAFRPLTARVR